MEFSVIWLCYSKSNCGISSSLCRITRSWHLPITVSPTWKVPDCIVISISFGVQYCVTLTPSKNPYNCVSGLHLVTLNSTFLERMVMITSRLQLYLQRFFIKLFSYNFLVPFLVWFSTLNVSRIYPLQLLLLYVNHLWVVNSYPPLIQPALIISSSVFCLFQFFNFTVRLFKPLQLVSHASSIV